MIRLGIFLLVFSVLIFQTGCADSSATASSNLDSNNQPVSSMPWNTPQPYETQGQLGTLSGR